MSISFGSNFTFSVAKLGEAAKEGFVDDGLKYDFDDAARLEQALRAESVRVAKLAPIARDSRDEFQSDLADSALAKEVEKNLLHADDVFAIIERSMKEFGDQLRMTGNAHDDADQQGRTRIEGNKFNSLQ
ncbi:hypothetical protein AB0B25_09365 [Nocardia sp. NPDC049190]|uniref:hypothetical protein n=1 Tax=Nocardia sp. NPDC049190 TaxID=3155650 RepID=UPI0034101192